MDLLLSMIKRGQTISVVTEIIGFLIVVKGTALMVYGGYLLFIRTVALFLGSKTIYENIAHKIGWEKKKGEKHTDVLLRGMVLYKLGSFGDSQTIEKAQEMFSLACHPERAKRPKDLLRMQVTSNKVRDSSLVAQNDIAV